MLIGVFCWTMKQGREWAEYGPAIMTFGAVLFGIWFVWRVVLWSLSRA